MVARRPRSGVGNGTDRQQASAGKKVTKWELWGNSWTWGWDRDTLLPPQDGGGALAKHARP